jgi:hypothetical protein
MFEDYGRVSSTDEALVKVAVNLYRPVLTKTGQGARIEAFYCSVPSLTVPGMLIGSYFQPILTSVGGPEDVLLNFDLREALKLHQETENARRKL